MHKKRPDVVKQNRATPFVIVVSIAVMFVGVISTLTGTLHGNEPSDATVKSNCAQTQHSALTGESASTVVEEIARNSMACYDLRAVIVRVTKDGKNIYTGAMGESMTGVAATPAMHFRNGSFAFSYIGEIFAQLIDQKKLRNLDQPLSRWLPDLPLSDQITIKNLLNMTQDTPITFTNPRYSTARLAIHSNSGSMKFSSILAYPSQWTSLLATTGATRTQTT